jgi:hypothetical protein
MPNNCPKPLGVKKSFVRKRLVARPKRFELLTPRFVVYTTALIRRDFSANRRLDQALRINALAGWLQTALRNPRGQWSVFKERESAEGFDAVIHSVRRPVVTRRELDGVKLARWRWLPQREEERFHCHVPRPINTPQTDRTPARKKLLLRRLCARLCPFG